MKIYWIFHHQKSLFVWWCSVLKCCKCYLFISDIHNRIMFSFQCLLFYVGPKLYSSERKYSFIIFYIYRDSIEQGFIIQWNTILSIVSIHRHFLFFIQFLLNLSSPPEIFATLAKLLDTLDYEWNLCNINMSLLFLLRCCCVTFDTYMKMLTKSVYRK